MLATLTDKPFSDPNWIFEPKLDGVRCLAFRKEKAIRLLSRNQKNLNQTYPEIEQALEEQARGQFIVDGEIVAFDGEVTSFARLQGRMHIGKADEARRNPIKVYYCLFDLLYLDGYDTTRVPLKYRKTLLKGALQFGDRLRYVHHRNTEGEAYLDEACRKGWEGLIAKQADSPYLQGRTTSWLKFKCVQRQEFVIGGYTDPQGSRIGFGALLVGYYEDGKFRYAGKVGTGYTDQTLRELSKKLYSLEQRCSPFFKAKIREKNVHWVAPKLVAEIGFTEWTEDKRLRHPRFLGLRTDKRAEHVFRERAKA
ncbi:MAG TPA: non-homologous end-joining DNA ligase [Candidatus Eisenbacteria bacterium]|nr:non-homologous end-joining DNA ligase [Candidatus Eisenbacteria bacterium]